MSSPDTGAPLADNQSLGQIVGELTQDLSRLMRQELELAKAEIREEATKAGKAAGMLGGAGFAGYMAVLLLSFALAYALSNVMDLGWATSIVGVVWAIVAGVLYAAGRSKLKQVSPKPEQTLETLKEDAEWVRHPTS